MTQINLVQAVQQVPGVTRVELLQAIKSGALFSTSTAAPWMVELSDVQAWAAARQKDQHEV